VVPQEGQKAPAFYSLAMPAYIFFAQVMRFLDGCV